MRVSLKNLVLSPWVILASIITGISTGLFLPGTAGYLSPVGEIYLKLLQMCVLPVMITAVVTSLGNVLQKGDAAIYLKRLVIVFAIGVALASTLGVVAGVIFAPGAHLTDSAKATLSGVIAHTEQLDQPLLAASGLMGFLHNIVPSNIFYALSNSQNLPTLFFCVLFGLALGLAPGQQAKDTLTLLGSIYDSCLKIISWVMLGLPIGLFCLFAGYIGEIGWPIFLALGKLIVIMLIVSVVLMAVFSMIVWRKTNFTYWQSLRALKTPLLIAFSTSSSFATMPATLWALQNNLKLDKDKTDLVIPLGSTLNQQSGAMHFALAAVFIAQLYGYHLSVAALLLIAFTSIFASIAASGIPGIAAATMFALVLEPLGLPTTVGIILLTAIEPIIDPLLTMVNVYGNCAAATLVSNFDISKDKEPSLELKQSA